MSRKYLYVSLLASAALILSAPFIGQIRNAIRDRFPGNYVLILGSAVGLAVAGALVLALLRIRERRAGRYALIATAFAVAAGYAAWTARPDPQINAVERFHFLEYGFVTLLFYRTWRPLGDSGVLLLPALAALTVAMVEEWFQWFIPGRVGALEDVLLNSAAIVAGLLFSLGLDPPPRWGLALGLPSRRQLGIVGCVAILVFGMFFDSVHLGYRITDARAGSFYSIYTLEELAGHAADRAQRWPQNPPVDRTRLAREDQYRTEGLQHVRRRNEAWSEGDIDAAWRENLILETYYAPVLEAHHRWPGEQREDAARRFASSRTDDGMRPAFVSGAYPYRVYTWPAWLFWAAIGALGSAVAGAAFASQAPNRRRT